MSKVCVVHLVWAPLGTDPLRRFVRSYRAHPGGRDHVLLVVMNGFSAGRELDAARAELAEVSHEELLLAQPVQDLMAYRAAAEHAASADALCFLNSHSEPLVDDWLALLTAQLDVSGAGIVGATGSHESTFSAAPRLLKPLRRRQYPPFPNPHLRTNAFVLPRELMRTLDWTLGRSKSSAHQLESGMRGITRQVLATGREAYVVGRDGHGYAPAAWPGSRTFRSGAQDNLLVADNRTREYAAAPPERRAQLARMAWDEAAADVSAPPAPARRA